MFDNAKWIGCGDVDLNFYPHYLSVFRVSYKLQVICGKASFIFGANDDRLNADSYIALETDTQSNTFSIYRVGYCSSDSAEKPIFSFPIPFTASNEAHVYTFSSVYGRMHFYIDGVKINAASETAPAFPFMDTSYVNLNPFGDGGDSPCYPHLCDIGFLVEDGSQVIFSDIEVRNFRETCSKLPLANLNDEYHLSGYFLETFNITSNGLPTLQTQFNSKNNIKKASLYATAHGIYDAELNGNLISDAFFAPDFTQYNKHLMYQAYDITADITEGNNLLDIRLGEGWWCGAISFQGENWNYFGDRPAFICEIVINYADGDIQTIVSNKNTFSISTSGAVRAGSFFQGEVYDFNRESITDWKPAVEQDQSGLCPLLDYSDCNIIPQLGPQVKAHTLLTAKAVTEPIPGTFIYDLCQNIAGVPRITIADGKKGQIITVRYAEMLYPKSGELMTENLRAAHCTDTLILRDGEQTFEPRFTFHGYRYLAISGIEHALPLDNVKSLALSSAEVSISPDFGDKWLNSLFSNIKWSLLDNFISIPTDCPQRNERMGWSGDLNVFARSAVKMIDQPDFFYRHLLALRDTQREDGRFADIAPIGNGFGGILWGSVGIILPWEMYKGFNAKGYNIVEKLREHYFSMKNYIDYLETTLNDEGIPSENGFGLGDWLSPQYAQNEPALLWLAYYCYDLEIMSKFADLFGDNIDAPRYRQNRTKAIAVFNRIFVDPITHETVFSSEDAMLKSRIAPMCAPPTIGLPERLLSGKYVCDTMTSYAVPLSLNVFDEVNKPYAETYLVESVRRENLDDYGNVCPPYSLMTGFIGTAWILYALTNAGHKDDAIKMLLNREYPSWLYPVTQGATTIWERLNSYTKENGFGGNNSMNSFNHYSFGAVAAWMLDELND
jgi:alpha-L-rhamnosidase